MTGAQKEKDPPQDADDKSDTNQAALVTRLCTRSTAQ